ncbi:hypothetical protein LLEC1_02729 [Akanthomyces lecanii]|uniref:Beta-lactamase-related domain-containing protein n=1 Tax=Cordyceps confragosa TaxID=2714763 RepID=A0A179IDY5_CORDF|nr:hypothetical protein LLEC1_02729 [Akanthomyces lecanii]
MSRPFWPKPKSVDGPNTPSTKLPSKTPFDEKLLLLLIRYWPISKSPASPLPSSIGNYTFTQGFGHATLPDTKVTPETLWLGASTTKAFVGAALSQFIQNGSYPAQLADGWSTPISSIIPDDVVLTDDWATRHLTLEDAAAHRTGMPRHDLSWKYTANGSHTPVGDVVRSLRHLHLTTEPRTVYQYCNIMYAVLLHVIETVTKQSLQTTFKGLIWAPLGMTSTYLDLREAKNSAHHLATGYYWDNATQSYGALQHDTLQESGASGIITSVVDHAKWVRSLIHYAPPLSLAAHADIRTPRFLGVGLYGLGWLRTAFHGEPLFHHAGQSLSFGTTIYWLPERQHGVVCANLAGEVVVRKLIEDAMGTAADKRHDWAPEYRKKLKNLPGFDGAVNSLYPNRTGKALPPSASLQDLAGEYYDTGYGRLTFQARGAAPGNGLPVRCPAGARFRRQLVGSLLPAQYLKASFKVDGKVSALDIVMDDELPGAKPFNVTFKKVD